MSQTGQLTVVQSTDGTHFTETLALGAAELEHFAFSGYATGRRLGRLRSLVVWSFENNSWELAFYRARDPRSADPNEDAFLGRVTLAVADGLQVGGAGLWRYYVEDLDLLLEDDADLSQVHVELINRSAGAKASYGAGGHFRLEVRIEPMLGF